MKTRRIKFVGIGLIVAILLFASTVSFILMKGSGGAFTRSAYMYQIGLLYSDGTAEVMIYKGTILGYKVPDVKLSESGCVYAINERGEKEIIACYVKRFAVLRTAKNAEMIPLPKQRKPRKKIINI